ncbi:MAG TPA: hypothetical protein VD794_01715 [Flavisolibacter sp.]|nr:hypothetical protein [Flavisolibacter sp.]
MKNTFLSAIIALFIGVSASAQSTVDSITAKYKLLPMPAPLTVEKTFPVLGAYQLNTGDAPAVNTQAVSATTPATSAPVSNATQTDSAAPATSTTTTPATTTDVTATAVTPSVTITLDSVNKGVVWIEGLPEGKFKAYLKKSPTTYRILAQKTNLGKQIPEGTLHYDVETNALHIALGKPYNEEDPTGIFAINAPATTTDVAATSTASTTKSKSSKSKSKVTFYTASKVITEPTLETEAQGGGTTTQDQQDQQ